jgi:hypothetical protein
LAHSEILEALELSGSDEDDNDDDLEDIVIEEDEEDGDEEEQIEETFHDVPEDVEAVLQVKIFIYIIK